MKVHLSKYTVSTSMVDRVINCINRDIERESRKNYCIDISYARPGVWANQIGIGGEFGSQPLMSFQPLMPT